MIITKVKNSADGYKVFLDDGREFDIPYIETTFLHKETKSYIDGGGIIEQEFTQSEQDAKDKSDFRIQRDLLLSETDKYMLVDKYAMLSATLQSDVSTYRQALRDSTLTLTLPIKPQGI